MPKLDPTPGQTVGPFFHYGLAYGGDNQLVPPAQPGSIRLHGSVLDGDGAPVPDALVEIWQPDGSGAIVSAAGSLHRDGWTFTGWGRSSTDSTGHYSLSTVIPGSAEPGRAPFFAVVVFARGLLDALFTRAYLPHGYLAGDPLLSTLEEHRRKTLVCQSDESGFRFDIRLQGENETVFLTYPKTTA